MKKIFKKIKATLNVVLAGVLVVPFLATSPLYADATDETVRNPEPNIIHEDGGDIVLYKTAKSVDGYANMWEVTLRIEAPAVTNTSDTVVVIDRSGSMAGTRMTRAKAAAKLLAEELLPEGNVINRVAIVSFGDDVSTDIGFSTEYAEVEAAIDGIDADGATFTQAGIRTAADLISTSTASYKNIILLSDGEPTYSYGFTDAALNDDSNFVSYGYNSQQTSDSVLKTVFNSTTVGNGSSMHACTVQEFWGYCSSGKYYNSGNSAIAEASYFKSQNIGDLYTIAFNTNATGGEVLEKIASPGKNKTATESNIEAIFGEIAGAISDLVESTSVHDAMAEGVIVENPQHSTELDWQPNLKYDSEKGIYWDEFTYPVEAGEHILDAQSTDGFHPLNKEATLTYNNGKTADFPVPYVKPFFINVVKTVEGQEGANAYDFNFAINHPNGDVINYSVKGNSTHRIVEAFPVGSYSIVETGTSSSNPIAIENYLKEYTGAEFEINEKHADHIDVTIKNIYDTVNVLASKVWDDDDNRDGLRIKYDDYWVVVKDNRGNYVDMAELELTGDKDNPSSYSFSNLPKYYNGDEIVYKVVEASGCEEDDNGVITCEDEFDGNNGEVSIDDDYTMEIGANNLITNKHIPATVKITVNKNWNDGDNRDGLRTETKQVEFCVTGKVSGEVVYEKTCKQASSLIAEIEIEFDGLPKYDNGEEIEYIVEESEFFGYVVTGLPEEAFTIEDEANLNAINTHTPETVDVLIQKVWDDNDDSEGMRPEEISVTLTGGDEDIPIVIEQGDMVEGECEEWCVLVEGLFKNKQGKAIEYSLSEDEVEGYTTQIAGDAENGFTITNTHEQAPDSDPCADGEGCGGDVVPIVPPITPNTGSLTLNKSEVATGSVEANYAIGGAMVALVSVAMLAMGVRKEVKLTK